VLLAAVGHTAGHVAAWGDVVVDTAVVEVVGEVEVLLQPTAPTASTVNTAATPRRRVVMLLICPQMPSI